MDRRKLRGRIIEKYGTQLNFSKELGVTNATVTNKMTGKTQFSQPEIVLWCKKLDICANDVGEFFFPQLLSKH